MTRILPIMEAAKKMDTLPEMLINDDEIAVIEITRRGKPVLAVLRWELYEAITETLEVMSDRETLKKLRESIEEMDEADTVSWKAAKRRLE